MEQHKCRVCLKTFSNGRALGGHMRSHMSNLPVPPKQDQPTQIGDDDDIESASSSSSSEEEGEDKGLGYGLRENPKKSFRLVDPEFSAVDVFSVVLQDRESETESSKNPTRRRSKRNRKKVGLAEHLCFQDHKKIKHDKLSKTESWPEPEPVSSISDTTTEEDVAFCLMMLSRDKWIEDEENQQRLYQEDENNDDDEEEEERFVDETDDSDELKSSKTKARGKYTCETCKKVFRSYQALGGHRASHKKIKACAPIQQVELEPETASNPISSEAKIHECPVCFRKFTSGQALGGHKRSHISGPAAAPLPPQPPSSRKSSSKVCDSLIDLNLPAPIEEDDISQIEHSAVSDAEFLNPIRR